jgi:tetratricopeptide (TPR) repeat protein
MKASPETQNEQYSLREGGTRMSVIRQWFAAVHETLDELILRYPNSSEADRACWSEQWNALKSMSDEVVEQWLLLEDKLSLCRDLQEQGEATPPAELLLDTFQKGQGYFKLHMFAQAAIHLEETVRSYPDLLSARLYLGMTRMHLKEWTEAQRHFRLIAALADEAKLKAAALNALGCIQAVFAQFDLARRLFREAIETDPSFREARRNLERCASGGGELELQFGSAELHAIV